MATLLENSPVRGMVAAVVVVVVVVVVINVL
jgi:hypothetical protein